MVENPVIEGIERNGIKMMIPNEFRGATVAVAEDMMINQQVITGMLGKAGIKVRLADNGQALLEILASESENEPVEMIFMDINMPIMDGVEATQKLRARGDTRPIIALSANAMSEVRARCINAGMDDFLPKPIELEELWAVLTRWLKPRASNQPALTAAPGSPSADNVLLRQAGIVPEEALARFLGDAAALWRAIQAFLTQHRDAAATLRTQLRAGQLDEFEKLAHGLKGSAGMMGAKKLEQLAKTLEELPAHMPAQETEALINQVAGMLEKIDATVAIYQATTTR